MNFPEIDKLTPRDKQRFELATNFKQMNKVFITLENVITECFDACITDLSVSYIESSEKNCIKKCHSKFFDHMQRSQMRLAENSEKYKGQGY